jgi:hypothetical protein
MGPHNKGSYWNKITSGQHQQGWRLHAQQSLAARNTSDRDLAARRESTTVDSPPTDLSVWALRADLILPAAAGRKTRDRRASVLNQFCLRMGTEPVPETLYLNESTRLIAQEDYIESCRRESFKTYTQSLRFPFLLNFTEYVWEFPLFLLSSLWVTVTQFCVKATKYDNSITADNVT